MNAETHAETEYCTRVEQLYEDIQQWLPGDLFEFGREKTWLNEEGIGEYFADKLALKDKAGAVVAALVPKGAQVIAAEGRVDLEGKYDTVPLLWLKQDGPSLSSSLNGAPVRTRFFFSRIESEGWYWIEDARRGKAHPVTSELLRELLWQVSDYEFD